ncbi:unnamed protein product [Paramecium sonneborni]|uniref:Uncharacterized protein n=1 Tax=Paramecium sonneborni TaxID=65129 RepID=A0A8S1QAF7_9CILI|nr:unnamed protein product [Paramecium sonneborni]
MIIIFLAINVIGKFSYPQFNQEQEISLYPTVGEFYQYQMGLESDSQLKCKMHPEVPNVEFINQCEKIYQTKGNQFKSMSSNSTHFGTLTNKNEVIIYEWKNSMIQQFGQSVPIDPLFNCFNINLLLLQQ